MTWRDHTIDTVEDFRIERRHRNRNILDTLGTLCRRNRYCRKCALRIILILVLRDGHGGHG